jgi:hypothetical protein
VIGATISNARLYSAPHALACSVSKRADPSGRACAEETFCWLVFVLVADLRCVTLLSIRPVPQPSSGLCLPLIKVEGARRLFQPFVPLDTNPIIVPDSQSHVV